MENNPLVSVGIPTYNRPEGLKRTLSFITNQTYQNLEIIISDNCSENMNVKEVSEELLLLDSRIKYYRQTKNIGMTPNFQFVLEKAKGEFFMWASDDDEWEPIFIETCLKYIGNAGTAMQHKFKTIVRETNQIIFYEHEGLLEIQNTFENTIKLLHDFTPPLIYGLHRRSTILFLIKGKDIDMLDVFFLMHQILHFGINTFPIQLYTSGIDSNDYILKPIKIRKNKLFSYKPLLIKTTKEIFRSKRLSFREKIIISKCFLFKILYNFTIYEKNHRPLQVKIIYRLLQVLIYINNYVCKVTRTKNYYLVENARK